MMLALRFAVRDLRSGVRGFTVFFACLALGVGALAAAGSTAAAFRDSLADQSRTLLGGDLTIAVEGRRFTPPERAAFAAAGSSETELHVAAMAAGPRARELVELRGVGSRYPLVGALALSDGRSLSQVFAPAGGLPGVAVSADLAKSLGVEKGDVLSIGDARFRVGGVLLQEPDRLTRGLALAPGVLVDQGVLERSGVIGPEALFGATARVLLPEAEGPLEAARALKRAAPAGDLDIRTRLEAAAGLGRLLDQLDLFLGFLGLASLTACGVGVWSAVSAYLDRKMTSIAVLKALGASGGEVRNIYLIELLFLGAFGVLLGVGLGAGAAPLAGLALRGRVDAPALFRPHLAPLMNAAALGSLALLIFSLLPLARARATRPAILLRRELAPRIVLGPEAGLLALALAAALWLLVRSAPAPTIASALVGVLLLAFGLLALLGEAARRAARPLAAFGRGAAALALANLAAPRSAARTVTPAIGFSVALLTGVFVIQSSLEAEIGRAVPKSAPSDVFTQIPARDGPAFDRLVADVLGPLGPDRYRRLPFFTGRITGLKERPLDRDAIAPAARWAFDRDIGMSAVDLLTEDGAPPAGFWPKGYAGDPKIVLDGTLAAGAGLSVGDEVSVTVLGRELEARIAGLRKVDWTGFAANFPVILDPSALTGAALRQIALLRLTEPQAARLDRAVAARFPDVLSVSVRAKLLEAARLFSQLALAAEGAAAVAALAGFLVLLSALAASAQARAREAAILKVLGAGRGEICLAYLIEYGLVGLVASGAGAALGLAAGWGVASALLHAPFVPDLPGLFALLAAFVVAASGMGLASGYLALGRRPASTLKE